MPATRCRFSPIEAGHQWGTGVMSDTFQLLVVDDDPDIRATLADYFGANGFAVTALGDGPALRAEADPDRFDIAILDLRLPGEDGLSLCRYLREVTDMGILMLTGAADSVDRVVGLEVGADDYVAKPFDLRELLARVRAILRRVKTAPAAETVKPEPDDESGFPFGTCRINPNARVLTNAEGEQLPLTSMEFDLLKAFHERPNRVMTRDALLEIAHGKDWEPFDRSIDVRITRLRKKIEPVPERPVYIKTVRGVGYRYDPKGE